METDYSIRARRELELFLDYSLDHYRNRESVVPAPSSREGKVIGHVIVNLETGEFEEREVKNLEAKANSE